MRHFIICVACLFLVSRLANAQAVSISAPLHSAGDSFFSRIGTNWGFQHVSPGGAMFFRQGGFGPSPTFGGFDPNGQSGFAFGGRHGNTRWDFRLLAAQGSSRTATSVVPSLTIPHGGFGFINDSMQRPFVTGLVPVVGEGVYRPTVAKQLARRKFQRAAARYAAAKQEREASEQHELAASRQQSRPKRIDDPPLVLGRRKTASASSTSR